MTSLAAQGVGTPTNPGPMTFSQLEQLWTQAGGPPSQAPTAAAIALAESQGNPTAINHTDPAGGSFGLWQINGVHAPGGSATSASSRPWVASMFDPLTNAQEAVALYESQGFKPWSTYTSGAYRAYYGGFQPQLASYVASASAGSSGTGCFQGKQGSQYLGLENPGKSFVSLPGLFGNVTLINRGQARAIKGYGLAFVGLIVMAGGLQLVLKTLALGGGMVKILNVIPGSSATASTVADVAPAAAAAAA